MLSDLQSGRLRRTSNYDEGLLFLTRFTRLFAYGALSVVLVFYLASVGLRESQIGLLLTLTLLGDTVISLSLTTQADRIGRRRMLIIGSILMVGSGLTFAFSRNFLFLIAAGTIGVISPSGNEVGPFLPIEQAALSEVVSSGARTKVFAWYSLTGAIATAAGSLCAGLLVQSFERTAAPAIPGSRVVVVVYAAMGIVLAAIFSRLTPASEVRGKSASPPKVRSLLGVGPSRRVVLRLSGLFALDAFGGGFVVQ